MELARIIEDKIFFEMITEMKKVFRKRNLISTGVDRVDNLREFLGIEEDEQESSSRNEEDEENMDRKWLMDDNEQPEEEEEN